MTLQIGQIAVEATGFHAPEGERFVARAHVEAGPEGLRHAYGATPVEAQALLEQKIETEMEHAND
jgi:hypothetical protein